MPDPGDGGVGFNWFAVELTSEYVPVAGDKGENWFVIDLVSVDVPVEPVEPPEVERGGGGERIVATGPFMFPFEARVPGTVWRYYRQTEFIQKVPVGFDRGIRESAFELTLSGQVTRVSGFEIRLAGFNEAARMNAMILTSDDELLLIL